MGFEPTSEAWEGSLNFTPNMSDKAIRWKSAADIAENLDQIATLPAKHEHLTGKRILRECRLHHPAQPNKSAPCLGRVFMKSPPETPTRPCTPSSGPAGDYWAPKGRSLLATAWAPMKFSLLLVRAGWVRSTARGMRNSGAQ
jgi:hypothetical protein